MSSKLSESAAIALRDIAHHIALVANFIGDMSFDQFAADIRTVYASVRCLEIISEASRRLPSDMKARHAQINWRNMAAAGNIYRHDDEDVEAQFVWRTVIDSLPSLDWRWKLNWLACDQREGAASWALADSQAAAVGRL